MPNRKPPKLPALPAPFRLAPKLPLQTIGSWNDKRAILHIVHHLVESERRKDLNYRYCYLDCLAMAVLGQDTPAAILEARTAINTLIRELNAYDPSAPLILASRVKYSKLLCVHFDTGRAGDLAIAYVERTRVQARADRALTLAKAMTRKLAARPPLVSPV